jgi:hypothetical protein
MYRTEDERVIFHDEEKASYWQVEDADPERRSATPSTRRRTSTR